MCEGSSKRCPAWITAPRVPTCNPSINHASYGLPVGVARCSRRGARSRNFGSMRLVYISGGSTIWESAEISLYVAMTRVLFSVWLHPGAAVQVTVMGSVLKVETTASLRGLTAVQTADCGLSRAAYLHI